MRLQMPLERIEQGFGVRGGVAVRHRFAASCGRRRAGGTGTGGAGQRTLRRSQRLDAQLGQEQVDLGAVAGFDLGAFNAFTALTVGGSVVTLTQPSFDPVELLDAGYAALKARSRRNLVVGGNSSGNGAERWIRGMRLANGSRPRMDSMSSAPPSTLGSAIATAIVWAWTSSPTNRVAFFMTGLLLRMWLCATVFSD